MSDDYVMACGCAGPKDPFLVPSQSSADVAAVVADHFDGAQALTVPGDSTTEETIGLGDSYNGVLETAGDADWIAIELAAGEVVQINVSGSGSTPLRNPFVEIYDADGNLVNQNDNSGPGRGAEVILVAEEAGTYFIAVTDSRGTATGDYTVTAVATDLPDPLDSIDWGGATLDSNTITVYFAPAGATYDGVTSEGWNAYEIQQFEAAFALIEASVDVEFVITDDPDADMRLVLDTNGEIGGGLGYFNPPGTRNEGVGVFNGAAWDREPGGSLEVGGYDFVTITHELLHGMGMAHPHDTGGGSPVMTNVEGSFDSYGDYDLNQGVYTTMSYNTGNPAGTPGDPRNEYGYEAGPMALDIAVLQEKYGANTTTGAAGDIYVLPGANESGTYWQAIWDVGGVDRISYDGNQNVTIDLRAATLQHEEGGGGFLSQVEGVAGGFTIAHGVVIENGFGGSGDDIIIGNDAANILLGRGGEDALYGGGADDIIVGGGDSDMLTGGEGGDVMLGGRGEDVFIFELGDSGPTSDDRDFILGFQSGSDLLDLSAVDDDTLIFIGTGAFSASGAGEVQLLGTGGAQTLVSVDADGDGVSDLQILLNGVSNLTADDFIL